MKLGAIVPVLNDTQFLPAVTSQLLKIVDRCLIMRSPKSFTGKPISLNPLPELDPKVDLVIGNFGNEAETRNAGMDMLRDCEYVVIADADEIFLDKDLNTLKALCEEGKHLAIGCKLYAYWKTPEYLITPPETLKPCVAIRYDVRFKDVRWPQVPLFQGDILMHHLSYVRTDEELKEKLANFSHANEIVKDWYDNVWCEWDNDKTMKNIHPTHPACYKEAVFNPNPELIDILKKTGCY